MDNADVKPEDIVSKLDSSDTSTEDDKGQIDWYSILQKGREKAESMEDKENSGIIRMRSRWANWVLFFIGVIIFFDMFLIFMYGTQRWSFADPLVVIAVITDNFLKIFGLGFLITREIFRKIFR